MQKPMTSREMRAVTMDGRDDQVLSFAHHRETVVGTTFPSSDGSSYVGDVFGVLVKVSQGSNSDDSAAAPDPFDLQTVTFLHRNDRCRSSCVGYLSTLDGRCENLAEVK